MADHVYKIIELTGSSPESSDQAVRNAVERASKTLYNLRWFEVTEVRGQLEDGKVAHWQVTVKIGFTLDAEIDDDDD
jgi:flavin-binding protein dodecin